MPRLPETSVLCVWEAAGQACKVLGGKAACLGFLVGAAFPREGLRPPVQEELSPTAHPAQRGGDHQPPQQTHSACAHNLSLLISQVIKGGCFHKENCP